MKREYIDIIFKAVGLKDVELLVFVLSKDINKDIFKSLAGITYRDNKNIYEYLLMKEQNEMLIAFIEFGFWAHVHMPINKHNETLLDLAYRVKNLPILLALLSNENAGYSASDENLKSVVDKLKSEYQTSSFLLTFINDKVMPIEYPEELNETKVHQCLNTPLSDDGIMSGEASNEPMTCYDEVTYETETVDASENDDYDWGQKADRFVLKIRDVFKNALSPLKDSHAADYKPYSKRQADYSEIDTATMEEEPEQKITEREFTIETEHPTEEVDVESHKSYYETDRTPTTKEIKDKIRGRSHDLNEKELDGLLKGFTYIDNIVIDSDIVRVDFGEEHDADFKKNVGLFFDISDLTFTTKRQQVAFIVKKVIDALSTDDLKCYATVKNFIALLNEHDIQVVPKIESQKVSSFDFIYDNESFTLSSLEDISMAEVRNVLYIDDKDDLFLVNQKITYLESIGNTNKEHLRLLITKSLLESDTLTSFIQKLKEEKIEIATSLKDFSLYKASNEHIASVSHFLSIYTYSKDNTVIDDEDLPEPIRFRNIRMRLLNR